MLYIILYYIGYYYDLTIFPLMNILIRKKNINKKKKHEASKYRINIGYYCKINQINIFVPYILKISASFLIQSLVTDCPYHIYFISQKKCTKTKSNETMKKKKKNQYFFVHLNSLLLIFFNFFFFRYY